MVEDEQSLERNDGLFLFKSVVGRQELSEPQELFQMRSEIGGARRVMLLGGQFTAGPSCGGGNSDGRRREGAIGGQFGDQAFSDGTVAMGIAP